MGDAVAPAQIAAPEDGDPFVPILVVFALFGWHPDTGYRNVRAGRKPFAPAGPLVVEKIGGRYFIRKAPLHAFIVGGAGVDEVDA